MAALQYRPYSHHTRSADARIRPASTPVLTRIRHRRDDLARVAARPPGRSLLLSEGRHVGLHAPGLQHPRQLGRVRAYRRRRDRRQPAGCRVAPQVQGEVRPALPSAGRHRPQHGRGLRRLGREDQLRQDLHGHRALDVRDRRRRQAGRDQAPRQARRAHRLGAGRGREADGGGAQLSTALPLDGLRVLDLTQVLAGPFCTMLLGDLGADVVKIERPGEGDGSRRWGPPFEGGESTYFMQVNRNKRSIAVDLRDAAGREVARRLIERADVVLHNFLPAAAARYGADAATVKAVNPRAVHCTIAGYPSDGPDAELPGYDFLMQGLGGIMSITGEPDGPPMKVAVAISDIVAGLFASSAVLSALLERERTGEGRAMEVSLLDAQVAWLANRAGDWLISGIVPERLGNAHPSIVPYETF